MIKRALAIRHLMDLLKVPGPSGGEAAVAALVIAKLIKCGCKKSWLRHDDAHKKIGGDYEVGNLIVKLPGTTRGPRRLFSGHMDTVPLCRGAVPVRRGNRIVPRTRTALGGDNRTAVSCLVTIVETLLHEKLPHPPLTFLFTVGEEVGLRGARQVKSSDLGKPAMGFNYDGGDPAAIIIGATGADRWQAEVRGISSHAGVHPEDGVSAVLITSKAISEIAAKGFFGDVRKGKKTGTSNVGPMQGGEATNQVTDLMVLRGECRSHDAAFLDRITKAYRRSFEAAAASVKNTAGESGSVKFNIARDYHSFEMKSDSPVVRQTQDAVKQLGLEPRLVIANGGLDANWLNRKGIPTVTLGAGQHNAHTLREYADIREYLLGCELGLSLASAI